MEHIIKTIAELGDFLKKPNEDLLAEAERQNPWFTIENSKKAISFWAESLNKNKLLEFTKGYQKTKKPKTVAIIMAGNIPLVGLHDLLCVILMGHKALVKLSSADSVLMGFVIKFLCERLASNVITVQDKLKKYDAIIATGSSSSKDYFEKYSKNIPNIIRSTRYSVAVLLGGETTIELQNLSNDIFTYFGLGCRSVAKIFVPKAYNFIPLIESFEAYKHLGLHNKFANNYTYRKAIFEMQGGRGVFDTGFFLLFESEEISSPIATLSYEFYDDLLSIKNKLLLAQNDIQIVLGNGFADLGSAQQPKLDDFADGINTLRFLQSI